MADEVASEVSDGGEIEASTYEVIRKRLVDQGTTLGERVGSLNTRRQELFGGVESALISTERVRTENNCIPRDVVSLNDKQLLLGYHVRMGLKKETSVGDVFAKLAFDGEHLNNDTFSLLNDPRFGKDFTELFQYYKDARLMQLRRTDTHLLMVFQTGERASDIKVLRWGLDTTGVAAYIDNRGERDHVYPPSFDFEWIRTTREDHVLGAHPHVNVADTIFVECIEGDLTIKVEDNTDDGSGVYAEDVEEQNQGLDDAEILYANLETMIVLKIRPYRETAYRYIVYNKQTRQATRIDSLGYSCQQLPEGHGLIFPNGFYLTDGTHKVFPIPAEDMEFIRKIRAPNGEDVAYVYHHRVDGRYIFLQYNLITREVAQPQVANGYCLFPDGKLIVFRADPEPQRLHTMQVWTTPFCSEDFASEVEDDSCFLATIGNRELVRGISDLLQVNRLIANQKPSTVVYQDLLKLITRASDSYHWLGHDEAFGLQAQLQEIRRTANTVIDEFEKVQQIQAQTAGQVQGLEHECHALFRDITLAEQTVIEDYVGALDQLRAIRGRVDTARGLRYVDNAALQALEDEIVRNQDQLSQGAVTCLQDEDALAAYTNNIAGQLEAAETINTATEGETIGGELDSISSQLDLLMEVVNGLDIADATARTDIIEAISEVYGQLNRARAVLGSRRQELGASEGRAEFAAQFTLLSQTVSNYLGLCDSPEKTDDLLAKLMVSVEELEAKFVEFDEFATQLGDKREEIYEAFQGRKQQLLDERQRHTQQLSRSAERIISSVRKRSMSFKEIDELNAYLASDPMVMKLKGIIKNLTELGDTVKADDCASQLKAAREDAVRHLRDQSELFEGDTIKLGRHRFSVNRQALELTMLPRDEGTVFHLSGTDYFEPVTDEAFLATRHLWSQELPSENTAVYRGEYLAWSILDAADNERDGLSIAKLREAAMKDKGLLEMVRGYASGRYEEGYERGLHDGDATAILEQLLHMTESVGLLRHPADARAAALLWYTGIDDSERDALTRRCRSLARLRAAYGLSDEHYALAADLAAPIAASAQALGLTLPDLTAAAAGRYALDQLGADGEHFVCSGEADTLIDGFVEHLDLKQLRTAFDDDLRALTDDRAATRRLVRAWLERYARGEKPGSLPVIDEAVATILTKDSMQHEVVHARTAVTVKGLLGNHPRIADKQLDLRIDEFLPRLERHHRETIPAYQAYLDLRKNLIDRERSGLRLGEFKPRVLTSFVRNRLINEVYLPMIGDNLAKQMGAVGDTKRTDLMGLLLLISPPGYGKTTLMEYIASVLGLTFMKINGPAIGHEATSIDPASAPNATARQELEKLNLALEMGNNVMLYLDDIQHCNPELLQKFISLCDGQRRIEGVWRGQTQTYDLRGKKVVVVMAGNPYTESGEKFQIPDMLANRADTYNLGDIIGGTAEAFELSYLENCLTVNPVLNPVASRSQQDFYRLLQIAEGDDSLRSELEHPYAAVELDEICQVLRHLRRVQQVLLKVNLLYIESASMSDEDRTEPAFKLQGSYRNMSKLAEKVVAVMNEDELEQLVIDHYRSESQTLTSAAEANLLRFYQLVGHMDAEKQARWDAITAGFERRQEMGDDDDPMQVAVRQLVSLN
nr:DNA repair ATPase [Planctomycetota bacterium]